MEMDREYKSKVDWWYHLVVILLGMMTVISFVKGASPLAMISLLLTTLWCVHILLTTKYRITTDGFLTAQCSFLPEKRVEISAIEAIEATMIPIFSYALSLDRMIIWSEGKPWMLISPVNRDEFVKLLLKMNPNIQLK